MAKDIIDRCKELGIDYERLRGVLGSGKDNWGYMVHSFEYLTVLGVVLDAMAQREAAEEAVHG